MKSSASWREILPIHPAAQLLPRMTEQELRELGEDIKSRGLLQPIFILQELLGEQTFVIRCSMASIDSMRWRWLASSSRSVTTAAAVGCLILRAIPTVS